MKIFDRGEKNLYPCLCKFLCLLSKKIGYFNEKIDFFRKNDFSFKKARRHFLYNNFLLLFVPKVKKMLVRFLRNFAGRKKERETHQKSLIRFLVFFLYSLMEHPTNDPPLCCSWSEKNSHTKIKLLAFMWWKLMRKNLKNVCGNPQKQNKHTHPQGGCVKY